MSLKMERHWEIRRKNGNGQWAIEQCKNKSTCPELYDLLGRIPDEKERRLWRRYGLRGWEEYEKILKRQGGGCGLCGKKVTSDGRRLAVDHCHETNRVRGILCSPCNRMLGLIDRVGVEKILYYLREGLS